MLTETLLRIPFTVISRCSLVPTFRPLIGCGENAQELTCHSQAASGLILKNQRRLHIGIFCAKIAAVGSLKRVSGWIFKFKYFQRSKPKL
jgi:hypothetical protein